MIALSFEAYRLYIQRAQAIRYVCTVGYAILACAGAYNFVLLYNLLVGGSILSLRTFMYPLFSNEYKVLDMLQLRIDIPISFYFIFTITFLCSGVYALFRVVAYREDKQLYILIGLLAIAGLGSSVYYINRFCYSNMQIVIPYFAIVIAIILDDYFNRRTGIQIKGLQDVFARGMLIILIAMSLESMGSLKNNVSVAQKSIHSLSERDDFINECWSIIPEKTAFIGVEADIVCMLTRCENMIYSMDWLDITDVGKEKVYNEIKENEEIEYLLVGEDIRDDVTLKFEKSTVEREILYDENMDYLGGKFFLIDLCK